MKISQKIKSVVFASAVVFSASALFYSCSKKSEMGPSSKSNSTVDQQAIKKASNFAAQISRIKIVADNGKVLGNINAKTGSFSFAEPHDGFHFSTNNGWEYVETADGTVIYVAAGAFGSNASSGGTVVAGNTSLDINYTFCLAASDAGDAFSFGPDTNSTGISIVMGISGDLESIINGNTDGKDIQDLFNGFAMYLVYADQISGSYDVVNWIDDKSSPFDDNKDKGFAWVIDFKNFHLYFSKEGKLTANGGTIGFEGKYLEFAPDADADDIFDFGDNPTVTEVDGSGEMGCN